MFQNDPVTSNAMTKEGHYCVKFAGASANILTQEGGSLSDSGISDSGSEQELSERERKLATLRRLTRSLENELLPPQNEALTELRKKITEVETELRDLQEQCRKLIIRTAMSIDARNAAKRAANQVHYPVE